MQTIIRYIKNMALRRRVYVIVTRKRGDVMGRVRNLLLESQTTTHFHLERGLWHSSPIH